MRSCRSPVSRVGRLIAFVSFVLGAGIVTAWADEPSGVDLKKLDADPHLMAWWKFDEKQGTRAADASGHDRAGQLEGGASFEEDAVPGALGGALALDGKDDAVRVPGYKGVVGTSPRTIALWIKTKSTSGELISWGTNDMGFGWSFCFIRRYLGINNGGYFYMAHEVQDGSWRHVAVVVREADLPNLHDDCTLYLDGKIAEIHKIGLLDLWPIETGDTLDVTMGQNFQGAIDDVRIYDRALSDEEIVTLYEAAK